MLTSGVLAILATVLAWPTPSTPTAHALPASCPGATYTVGSGDSWYAIASRNSVSLNALLAANDAVATTMIHPGNRLCLPASASTPTTPATTPTTPPTAPPASSGSCAQTYVVLSGDYWSKIASKVGTTLAALLAANNATATTMIHPGNQLCVPAGATGTTTTTTPSAPTGSSAIAQFPVQGPCSFTDTYGANRSGGRFHEGVDLIAKTGQYIYAVADGTLTKKYLAATASLTGNGWRLTKPDGTYYFYAHMSTFAEGLSEGSKVKQGQILGQVGATGNAGTPHLHFEVHPGGGASINPTPVVSAVNGCSVTVVPPQPNGIPPVTTPTTPPATTPPATTPPATPPPTPIVVPPVSGSAKLWQFIAPVTVLDTGTSKLAANATRSLKVVAPSSVPDSTPGVMLRVTARNVTSSGFITVHQCDGAAQTASTINVQANRVNAAMAMVRVIDGNACVFSSVKVDVKVEVVGYLASSGAGVTPIVATRALDTRTGTAMAANSTRSLSPSALGSGNGATAVSVTVTVIDVTSAGSIGIGPCGGTPWIVPFPAVQMQSFAAVVRTNDAGVCVSTTTKAHVIVDVDGVFRSGAPPLLPLGPTRVYDSRFQDGIVLGDRTVHLALPAGTTTAQLSFALVAGNNDSSVFAWPCSQPRPAASVGSSQGNMVTAVSATMDVSGGNVCVAATQPVQVVIDLAAVG